MTRIRAHILAAGLAGAACLIACSSKTTSAPRPRTEPLVTSSGARAGAQDTTATGGASSAASPANMGSGNAISAGANGMLDAGKVIVGGARSITYDTSDKKGDVVAVVEGAPDCHCTGRMWWVREYRGGPGGGDAAHETHYTFDAGGNIAVIEEIDRVDRVEVVYTPPMVVVPDKIRAQGEDGKPAFTQSVSMVVHPLGDRSKVRTHGPTTVEIRYAGDEGIKTGEGTIAAHRVLTTITANLSAARTVDTTESWWADGIGLVGQKEEEKTMVFGAKVRDNAQTLVMKSRAG